MRDPEGIFYDSFRFQVLRVTFRDLGFHTPIYLSVLIFLNEMLLSFQLGVWHFMEWICLFHVFFVAYSITRPYRPFKRAKGKKLSGFQIRLLMFTVKKDISTYLTWNNLEEGAFKNYIHGSELPISGNPMLDHLNF